MRAKYLVALVAAVALTGCGTHLAPGAGLAPSSLAAQGHKKPTPDNEPLSANEIKMATAAVEKALNKRVPDDFETVSDLKFTRTAAVGVYGFTGTRTLVGMTGVPEKSAIAGTVIVPTGDVILK